MLAWRRHKETHPLQADATHSRYIVCTKVVSNSQPSQDVSVCARTSNNTCQKYKENISAKQRCPWYRNNIGLACAQIPSLRNPLNFLSPLHFQPHWMRDQRVCLRTNFACVLSASMTSTCGPRLNYLSAIKHGNRKSPKQIMMLKNWKLHFFTERILMDVDVRLPG